MPKSPWSIALLVNATLLAVFALQHSGMARPAFKRKWTKIVPKPIERATYVLFSNVAMIVLFCFWQPLGGQIWLVENRAGFIAMYVLYGAGWATVLYTTCLLNHFELFGLRQVWLYFRGRPYTQLPFAETKLVQVCSTPAIRWLAHGHVVYTVDDRIALALRVWFNCLHPDRYST